MDRESGDNIVLNDTEIREFEFVVNGKNPDKNKLKLEGLRCLTGVCNLDDVVEVPLMDG